MLSHLLVACALLGTASAFVQAPAGTALRPTLPAVSRGHGLSRSPMGLRMAEEVEEKKNELNPWLSLNTRGGAMLWTTVLLFLPIPVYGPLSAAMGDELAAGRALGAFYCLGGIIAWTGSYVFRVGTKDMTYTKQLKQYEDAVIAKRFEELQADEVDALLNDMDNDKPNDGPEPPVIKGSGWRPDQY
uniref:Uncharacterized protein n=1 Tax=Hemiselmis andersenii TaxID=464988 RepID=A0A6U4N6D0_HEMAN|mmetsp:Transcript_8852/g.21687  ORF Transcript_8852/g.21687 Transcript_8852/m.21687 type:complete len:187 (+) Transcript_8852:43-603(+)